MEKELTVKEVIKIQTEQLQEWKQLLKPEIYDWLEKRVTKDNHLAKSGDSIVRGSCITTNVENYLYYKERGYL